MAAPLRGLPPPAAMTLPSPTQSSSLGQLPDRWQQGSEETQRVWLQAKMEEERRRQEEERRKQEEERTKQEHLRLDVRRTELEMLREAMQGGMPPQLVPVIFTGGGAMAGSSAEWASQYVAEMHRNQQHIQQTVAAHEQTLSPHLRRGSRLIAATEHATPLQTPQQAPLSVGPRVPPPPPPPPSGNPQPPPPPGGNYAFSTSSATSRPPQHHQPHQQQSQPGTPMRTQLPSINTSEMKIHPPPQGPPGMPMQLQPLQQQQPQHQHNPSSTPATGQPPPSHQSQQAMSDSQRQTEQSPSIFFHHWQPPASSQPTSGSTQATSTSSPPSKQLDSPFSQRGDSGNSPKKRKAGNISQTSQPAQYQPPQIAPTSQGTTGQITFSPPFSSGGSSQSGAARRRPPGRNRSDSGPSRGYDPYNKTNRQKRSEFSDPPVGGGSMGQFSLSNITTPDDSPEQRDTQHQPHSHHQTHHQRPPSSHHGYPSSAPETRRDLPPFQMSSHMKAERNGSNT